MADEPIPDVTGLSLEALLAGDDPVLEAGVRRLIAGLTEPGEPISGWQSREPPSRKTGDG